MTHQDCQEGTQQDTTRLLSRVSCRNTSNQINIKQHQWSLCFIDDELELNFLHRYYGRTFGRVRLTLAIAIGLWFIYAMLDKVRLKFIHSNEMYFIEKYSADMVCCIFALTSSIASLLVIQFYYSGENCWKNVVKVELLLTYATVVACCYSCIEFTLWDRDRLPAFPLVYISIIHLLLRIRHYYSYPTTLFSLLSYFIAHCIVEPYLNLNTLLNILWIGLICVLNLVQLRVIEGYFRSHFISEYQLESHNEKIRVEAHNCQQLLYNILPKHFLFFLEANYTVDFGRIHYLKDTCILLSDIEGFTKFSQSVSARELLRILNLQFSAFDKLASIHGVSKIKTIGDAYFAITCKTGNEHNELYIKNCVDMALDMIESNRELNRINDWNFNLRVGMSHGDVYPCVLGRSRITFDLFGVKSVEYAILMEETGAVNRVHVTNTVVELLAETGFPSDYQITEDSIHKCPFFEENKFKTYYIERKRAHHHVDMTYDIDLTRMDVSIQEEVMEQVSCMLELPPVQSVESVLPSINRTLLILYKWKDMICYGKDILDNVANNFQQVYLYHSLFFILILFNILLLKAQWPPFSDSVRIIVLFISAIGHPVISLLALVVKNRKKLIIAGYIFSGVATIAVTICVQFDNILKYSCSPICVIWMLHLITFVPLVPFVVRLVTIPTILALFITLDQLITRFFFKNDYFAYRITDISMTTFCAVGLLFTCYFNGKSTLEEWIMGRVLATQEKVLCRNYHRTELLLKSVLPQDVVSDLRITPYISSHEVCNGCATFIRVEGFEDECFRNGNTLASITLLDELFVAYDALCEEMYCDKVKSIKDVFFVVTGARKTCHGYQSNSHKSAKRLISFLLQIMAVTKQIREKHRFSIGNIENWKAKIGASQGNIISGVVGEGKFCYDYFGTTINEASRMMSTGVSGKIQITPALKQSIEQVKKYIVTPRERAIQVKGIGEMTTYFVEGRCHVSSVANT
jgi:class 3 adenylate cyclase